MCAHKGGDGIGRNQVSAAQKKKGRVDCRHSQTQTQLPTGRKRGAKVKPRLGQNAYVEEAD